MFAALELFIACIIAWYGYGSYQASEVGLFGFDMFMLGALLADLAHNILNDR